MPFIIGTDEAGYGPNFGPLVISATLWHLPEATGGREQELERVLDDTLTPPVAESPTLVIADSKLLYSSGGGLAGLERGVYAALRLLESRPSRWREIWPVLAPDAADLAQIPWYASYDRALPVDLDAAQLTSLCDGWRGRLQQKQVSLLAVRSAVVFEEKFNDLVDQWGSKGELLSRLTLGLVRDLSLACELRYGTARPEGCWAPPDVIARLSGDSLLVHCDKHGGRNKYGPLLQTLFPEYLVEIHEESRACSRYRTGPRTRRCEFRFQARGERFLPVALASMVSKYLRELAMLAFNAFWQQHLPELRPTAGYPGDARRFRADIAACQTHLQIPDRRLWRNL